MKKNIKTMLLGIITICICIVLGFSIYKFYEYKQKEQSIEESMLINDEIIVFAADGTKLEDIEKLAQKYNGKVASYMDDICIGRIHFNESKTEEELNELILNFKEEPYIEDVHLNYIVDIAPDTQ